MKRSLVYAIALMAALAACSGDDTADPTTTLAPTAASTSPAPTSTAPPSTTSPTTTAPGTTVATTVGSVSTTAPTTSVASTAPAGEADWRLVLESLGRRRQDLYRAPDVTRIGEVCTDTGPCAEQLSVQLGDMASKGWHIEGGDPYTVLEAELEDFTGDTLETSDIVTVIAVVQRQAAGGTIVDAAGAVVAEVEADTDEGFNPQARITLARGGPAGDEWRIVDTARIRQVPA